MEGRMEGRKDGEDGGKDGGKGKDQSRRGTYLCPSIYFGVFIRLDAKCFVTHVVLLLQHCCSCCCYCSCCCFGFLYVYHRTRREVMQ
jgi:hypothetical protein